MTVARPLPTINLEPDKPMPTALEVIAAGIGSWRLQSAIPRLYQRPSALIDLLMEEATGRDNQQMLAEQEHSPTAQRYLAVRDEIGLIVNDIPDQVWRRVLDELFDCNPETAFRIIQMHVNVVHALTHDDLPDRAPATQLLHVWKVS